MNGLVHPRRCARVVLVASRDSLEAGTLAGHGGVADIAQPHPLSRRRREGVWLTTIAAGGGSPGNTSNKRCVVLRGLDSDASRVRSHAHSDRMAGGTTKGTTRSCGGNDDDMHRENSSEAKGVTRGLLANMRAHGTPGAIMPLPAIDSASKIVTRKPRHAMAWWGSCQWEHVLVRHFGRARWRERDPARAPRRYGVPKLSVTALIAAESGAMRFGPAGTPFCLRM